jgi:hypothetical protein
MLTMLNRKAIWPSIQVAKKTTWCQMDMELMMDL